MVEMVSRMAPKSHAMSDFKFGATRLQVDFQTPHISKLQTRTGCLSYHSPMAAYIAFSPEREVDMLSLSHQKWLRALAQNNLVHDLWTISAWPVFPRLLHHQHYAPLYPIRLLRSIRVLHQRPAANTQWAEENHESVFEIHGSTVACTATFCASILFLAASIDTRWVGVYYGVLGIVYTEDSYRTANWGRKSQYALFWSQVYKPDRLCRSPVMISYDIPYIRLVLQHNRNSTKEQCGSKTYNTEPCCINNPIRDR